MTKLWVKQIGRGEAVVVLVRTKADEFLLLVSPEVRLDHVLI